MFRQCTETSSEYGTRYPSATLEYTCNLIDLISGPQAIDGFHENITEF